MKESKTARYLGKYCVAGAGPHNESCKNSSTTSGISMHEFPKLGNHLRNAWIQFVRRHRMPDWQPSPFSCLCSAHFEEQYFNQRLDLGLQINSDNKTKRLLGRSCAIPTIDTVRSVGTSTTVSKRERRQVMKFCCIYLYWQNICNEIEIKTIGIINRFKNVFNRFFVMQIS